jgi:hypothetical protein
MGVSSEMTCEEWAACQAPDRLLEFLHRQGRTSARKWRLFACGCDRLLDCLGEASEDLREAVAAAEAFADRKARRADLAPHARFVVAKPDAWKAARTCIRDASLRGKTAQVVALVHCVFGDPFHPTELPPAWRTADVRALADEVYAEPAEPGGEFDGLRLGILADALEDAGCTHPAFLAHLRDGGRHVRGCHVLDALLGKG